ncbi:hypothetical protein N307_06866, partial [Dryobates pubescens]
KPGCMWSYQIAGMKKKSTFLLPVFVAFQLWCLLLAKAGGGNALSPPETWGRGSCPARWLCKAGRLLLLSCWEIKEILCFGLNPRGFEVLGGICWPGKASS